MDCPICWDADSDKTLKGCGHSFHTECIKTWYDTNNGATCPMCRSYINRNDIYPRNEKFITFDSVINSSNVLEKIKDVDINRRNITGDTFLIFACKTDNQELAEYLLDNGVDVNEENDCGNTALIWASFVGSLPLVKLLLERGANIDHRNNCDNTAFSWSCRNGYQDIVEYLVEKDCDTRYDNVVKYCRRYPLLN